MQVSTKFTIAVHMIAATEYFKNQYKITSSFLSSSTGVNPVIIRNLMDQLKKAGIIEIKRGPGGITLLKDLKDISFLDIYDAVETKSNDELFRFHEKPNLQCPVGKNIHASLDLTLNDIQNEFRKELAKHNMYEVYNNIKKLNQD